MSKHAVMSECTFSICWKAGPVLDKYSTRHKVHRFLDMPRTSNCCVEEADIAFHTGKHLEEVPRTFGGHLMCLKIPTRIEKRTDSYACSFKSGRGGEFTPVWTLSSLASVSWIQKCKRDFCDTICNSIVCGSWQYYYYYYCHFTLFDMQWSLSWSKQFE